MLEMILMLNTMKIQIKKGPKFKVDDCVRIQNTKTFLLKDILQIGQERFLVLIKIKNTVPWTYVVSDLNGKKIIGSFYEKELQKTSQKNL